MERVTRYSISFCQSTGKNGKEIIIRSIFYQQKCNKLLQLLKNHDSNTYAHGLRMAENIPVLVKEAPELITIEPENLAMGCALHDIGKIAIPTEIINKPGKLTETEKEIIQSHTMKGGYFVNDLPSDIYMCVLFHHERENGNGYPFGLKCVPDFCRLLAVLDVLDALTSQRPYKHSITDYKELNAAMHSSDLDGYYVEKIMDLVQKGCITTEKEIQHYAEIYKGK